MPKPSPNLSGFEKSVTMTMAAPEEAEAVTCAVWNISKYPVPRGFDGSLVRPFIKRYLEKYGYIGPLTITAVGVLTDVPDSILRGIYNSGINLIHVPAGRPLEMVTHIYPFTELNPPPANIISISDPNLGLALFFQRAEYNILQPFSSCVAFQTDLLSADDLVPDEETESAYWDCLVCRRDPPAQRYENFTSHLSSEEHQELTLERSLPRVVRHAVDSRPPARPVTPVSMQPSGPPKIDHKAVTSVFWDINKCPVPPGHDARLVIKRFLETSGYSGPLTITAVGVLTDVPNDILRRVYSSGIALSNVVTGASDIPYLIHEFGVSKPPPANIMVISDPGSYLSRFTPSGYNCLFQPSLESLLVADSGVLEDDKCSEMGDCICYVCSDSSGLAFQSFEDFTTHLASRRHQRTMLDFVPQNVRISRRHVGSN